VASQKTREDMYAELEPLRARILKQRLGDLKVDTSSCYDKESLLTKLVDTMLETAEKKAEAEAESSSSQRVYEEERDQWKGSFDSSSIVRVPLVWTQAAPLFAGVKTQQGEYAGIELKFLDRSNGQTPLGFIIDTACTTNCVLPRVVSMLNAPPTGVTSSGVGGTGNLGGAQEVLLGRAEADGKQRLWMDGIRAQVIDLPTGEGTAGILGLAFLNQCGAIKFSWGSRPGTCTLYSRHTSWMDITRDLDMISLVPVQTTNGAGGLPCARVRLNGKEALALVDTGAAFTCANRACGVEVDPTVEPMFVTGADGNPMQMGVSKGGLNIRLDDAPEVADEHGLLLRDVTCLVGDLPAFGLMGLPPGRAAIILGLDALKQRPEVVISTSANCMWL